MKKLVLGAMVCALLLGACAPVVRINESFALDTICIQQVSSSSAEAAIEEVNTMLQRITRAYSVFDGTELKAINDAAPGSAAVSNEAAALIQTALDIAQQTNGAFDPTIGPLSVLWDMSSESPAVPQETAIEAALELVDYRRVSIEGDSVTLPQAGMMIDLGGIAKGYAADLAVKIYEKHGVGSALLNLGGNIYALGKRTDGGDWRIGLRDPFGQPGEYAAVIPVSNSSVVTSGSYERFFESGGNIYHHILDPQTGYPAQNSLAAVTVVCSNSTRADALSTALFVMGLDKGLAFAQGLPDVEAVFLTDTRQIYVTDGLREGIEITNEAYILQS